MKTIRKQLLLMFLLLDGCISSLAQSPSFSGTLPVLFITVPAEGNLPDCCTFIDGTSFLYLEDSKNWDQVYCQIWNDENGQADSPAPFFAMQKVGVTQEGNSIWRWTDTEGIFDDAKPNRIRFGNGTDYTTKKFFANGGVYKFDQKDDSTAVCCLTKGENGSTSLVVTSHDQYLMAKGYIDPMGDVGCQALGSMESPISLSIKARGNWTWKGYDKKPYKLKFDHKESPLGLNENKHFALMAHADDEMGFLRNTIGFEVSRRLGLDWTPTQQPVEVVFNGEYIGLYFLTETIRVGENRVNIIEREDEETDETAIANGGWLVEIDNYEEDGQVRITEGSGEPMRFTPISPEQLSQQQYDYLHQLVTSANDAIFSEEKDGREWEDIIDLDALVRFYICQEVVDNREAFRGSCYFHKYGGGDSKIVFGPVWDFGNAFRRETNKFIYEGLQYPFINLWIGEIAKFKYFQQRVSEVWKTFYNSNQLNSIDEYIDAFTDHISAAFDSNRRRWPQYSYADLEVCRQTFKGLLHMKTQFLDGKWNDTVTDIAKTASLDDTNDQVKYYTIEGRPLSGTPQEKGIYIVRSAKGCRKTVVQ